MSFSQSDCSICEQYDGVTNIILDSINVRQCKKEEANTILYDLYTLVHINQGSVIAFLNNFRKLRNIRYYNDSTLVGKLFIDIADIYCFGTGLPISRSKHVFQYRHFK